MERGRKNRKKIKRSKNKKYKMGQRRKYVKQLNKREINYKSKIVKDD